MSLPVRLEHPLDIDASLVRRLIAEQFPQWSQFTVRPVEVGGWDNRTFHLGEGMSVRLPSAERYADKVKKETQWLPVLRDHLPLPIPQPIAVGSPGCGYPWPWSIYRWIEGRDASVGHIENLEDFARDLAAFLLKLQNIPAGDGPAGGKHNFYRGASLSVYDAEARAAIDSLREKIDVKEATDVWNRSVRSQWNRQQIWIHGDVSASNLLVHDGKLAAVIDFGGMGVGDPACDLTIAWTLFASGSRDQFRAGMGLDKQTWERARGWALWKAAITLAELEDTTTDKAAKAFRVIEAVLAEHDRSNGL
ncbi:MAG: aminoglycoside phosphotransferase family protein [Planctomycetota bacterium]